MICNAVSSLTGRMAKTSHDSQNNLEALMMFSVVMSQNVPHVVTSLQNDNVIVEYLSFYITRSDGDTAKY